MRFWYVPLEQLKARYTGQLRLWIRSAFDSVNPIVSADHDGEYEWEEVRPPTVSDEIRSGSVLDGVNRGVVSLYQMSVLVEAAAGTITNDDVIYLQDMWTPGLEALAYALHLRNVKPRIYAMCHAQSVDEYDFTYPMRHWMRPIEIAYSRMFAGMFVASTIHRDQLKAAGVECPIHVVGLPIDPENVRNFMHGKVVPRENLVVFSSRLNNEKNPWFMLKVAQQFLKINQGWTWEVTTSAAHFTSEVKGLLDALKDFEAKEPRFKLRAGLTKPQYYDTLRRAKIQFNSSLQDYVSWTMLEALAAGCNLCYPRFRSFPECVPSHRLYDPFNVDSALVTLMNYGITPDFQFGQGRNALEICNMGRLVEMSIMLQNYRGPEVNVWHQPEEYFKHAELLP